MTDSGKMADCKTEYWDERYVILCVSCLASFLVACSTRVILACVSVYTHVFIPTVLFAFVLTIYITGNVEHTLFSWNIMCLLLLLAWAFNFVLMGLRLGCVIFLVPIITTFIFFIDTGCSGTMQLLMVLSVCIGFQIDVIIQASV